MTIDFVCPWKIDCHLLCESFLLTNICWQLILNERVFQVPFKWLVLTYFSVIERRKWNDFVSSQTCVANESSFFWNNQIRHTLTSPCHFLQVGKKVWEILSDDWFFDQNKQFCVLREKILVSSEISTWKFVCTTNV